MVTAPSKLRLVRRSDCRSRRGGFPRPRQSPPDPACHSPGRGCSRDGGQLGEPDPSHLGTAGLVVDELVEVVIVEVHRVVDVHIVRHVAPGGAAAPAAAHLDDQVAVELIPGVRPALEGQGNRPLIIPLGHKGQVVDLVPVELLVLLYFAFTGVAIVVVEGALAGGGQVGEEDVIDLGASDSS